MVVEWLQKEFLEAVEQEASRVERNIAKLVESAAKAMVPKQTGTLRREIDIKASKFKDGGYIVRAQGPGNYTRYYATFVEFGTYKDAAQPYLRPAVKKYERIGHEMLKRAIL